MVCNYQKMLFFAVNYLLQFSAHFRSLSAETVDPIRHEIAHLLSTSAAELHFQCLNQMLGLYYLKQSTGHW